MPDFTITRPWRSLMGASNVMAAYAKYAGKVPALSMQVLAYMAVVSVDSDKHPWYGQGHHALAEHALGRPAPITASDIRAVERALAPLAAVGAIRTDRKAAVRRDGPNTARYRLNLDPTEAVHVPRNPSGVTPPSVPSEPTTVDGGDPPRPTVSDADARRIPDSRPTVSGTDARRKPSDRGVRGTTRSDKTEEESDDLRTDVAVVDATPAEHTPDSPTTLRPAKCSHGLPAGLRADGLARCALCRVAARAPTPPPPEPDPDPTARGPDDGQRPQLRLIQGAA